MVERTEKMVGNADRKVNMPKYIYTIGHKPLVCFEQFIENLKKHNVNCVVDIRHEPCGLQNGDFDKDILQKKLTKYRIWYLPFYEEFGRNNAGAFKPQASSFKRITESEEFSKGIRRLEAGISKGCNIALLASDSSPLYCYRSIILGHYLKEYNWEVNHILDNGNIMKQETIENYWEQNKENKEVSNTQIHDLGQTGEKLATFYLTNNGYRILETNWNLHKGCELDIIAFKDSTLHAIEVKTRSGSSIAPEQAINDDKLTNIIKAFNAYRNQKHLTNLPSQIDSIAIIYHNEDDYIINMYEDLVKRRKRFY